MADQSNSCQFSFSEKIRILSDDFLRCCLYIARPDVTGEYLTKKLYSSLIATTQVLEDFLDFHGAKNCHNWYYFREMTAAVRHLSLGSYSLRHVSNRLVFYDLPDHDRFEAGARATRVFLTRSLRKLAPAVLDEARRLCISIPERTFDHADFPRIVTSEMLTYDIDDEDKDIQKEYIVKIASQFLSIAEKFEEIGFFKPLDIKEILSIVPIKVNEVEIRRFEMLVHNLQSSFDTYVIHGGFRYGNRKLKRLRSFFSVVFHLLQMIGRLLHFYERHLHDAGYKDSYKEVQERMSLLVDPETLLNQTINYGLYYVCHYLNVGKKLAKTILNKNIERSSIVVGIPVKLGFHSRPSLLVAKVVQHYGGQVELVVGDARFDASSVLDIQWAGGKIHKERISEVTFEGDWRALKDIRILASVNYGEDSMGKGVPLPEGLKYLC